MRITLDTRRYTMYNFPTAKVHGATELLIMQAARALTELGHSVNIITAFDEEMVMPDGVQVWPQSYFPRKADVVVSYDQMTNAPEFLTDHHILATTFAAAPTGGMEGKLDRVLVLSQTHKDYMVALNGKLDADKIQVFPSCVDLNDYREPTPPKVPGRLIWCNSPDRGLWHLMEMWPALREAIPGISLVITYDMEVFLARVKWMHDGLAHRAWLLKEWTQTEPDVHNLGGLSREQLVQEQLKAQAFPYTCDPPNVGMMVHCIAALECAAAGCVLVMPKLEGFPEVFGEAAIMTEVPLDYQEWVKVLVRATGAPLNVNLEAGRKLVEAQSYERYRENWEKLLEEVCVR